MEEAWSTIFNHEYIFYDFTLMDIDEKYNNRKKTTMLLNIVPRRTWM
jgi:hypothetical protein